ARERVAPRTAGAGGVASGRGVARPGHPGRGRRRRAGKRVVSGPAGFLSAFAHALAAMTLYAAGHPARERAIDDAFQQLHAVKSQGVVPLTEAEAVVRSLSIAMHSDRQLVIPLLQLKEFDQYTTTHSMNVAVLTMALAEHLGLGAREVRNFGIAGLLHDIGKVRIPLDVLTKPGRFTDEERALMNQHPIEGARIILKSEEQLELPAVVAYEHHIMLNGGGYPTLRFRRDCHRASKLVHVCDVYDALR